MISNSLTITCCVTGEYGLHVRGLQDVLPQHTHDMGPITLDHVRIRWPGCGDVPHCHTLQRCVPRTLCLLSQEEQEIQR